MAFDFPASPVEGQQFASPGGPLYVYESPVWKIAGITTTPGEWVINEIVITSSQAYNKPANLAYLEATVIGAGGGSNDVSSTGASVSAASGGGGGGGTSIKLYDGADVPASVAMTVGVGTRTNGGSSTFLSQTGAGGSGGTAQTGAAGTLGISNGGAGGVSSGGDLNITGTGGGLGVRAAHGVAAAGIGGEGGGSFYAPVTMPGYGSTVPGSSPTQPGGGSRGAGNNASQAAAAGGTGGPGLIILREYYPLWVLDAAAAPGTVRETLIETTQVYAKPVGLKFLEVEIQAPGGAGGGAVATAATPTASAGGGGASGGWGMKLFDAADIPASVTVTVGSAGAANQGAAGGAGGTTSFGSLCQCTGGGGGGTTSAVASFTNIAGGSPGTASGFTINVPGTYGGWGSAMIATGQNRIAEGIASRYGSGPPSLHTTSYSGFPGTGYGSGGGSSCNYGSQTNKPGGAGAPGFVKLKEYF